MSILPPLSVLERRENVVLQDEIPREANTKRIQERQRQTQQQRVVAQRKVDSIATSVAHEKEIEIVATTHI